MSAQGAESQALDDMDLPDDVFLVEDASDDEDEEWEAEPEAELPPPVPNELTDCIPMSFGLTRTIQNHASPVPLLVLFDPGTKNVWINARKVPKDANRG